MSDISDIDHTVLQTVNLKAITDIIKPMFKPMFKNLRMFCPC